MLLAMSVLVLAAGIAGLPTPDPASGRTEVYFGDGCFWERQYAYVQVEMNTFNRSMVEVTSHTGYAGSKKVGDDKLVCYHHDAGDPSDDYSLLGQSEVTAVLLDAGQESKQYAALIDNFFRSFVPSPGGAARPDPGDMGGQYRSVLGLPGGMQSDLYPLVKKYNLNKMDLINGIGGEDDKFNAVYVYDSTAFPFFRAEKYMQFHCNFVPPGYPPSYLDTLYNIQDKAGLINQTGCPESDRNAWC